MSLGRLAHHPAGTRWTVERIVPLPTAQVTKCAFAGPDLTTLYMTTAAIGRDPHIDPMAGHLFTCPSAASADCAPTSSKARPNDDGRSASIDGVEICGDHAVSDPDGMEMRVLSWGAVIRDLVVPSPGGPQPVVLGLNSIDDYAAHSPYFGAIVGRYANRIGGARFVLDGHHVSARRE